MYFFPFVSIFIISMYLLITHCAFLNVRVSNHAGVCDNNRFALLCHATCQYDRPTFFPSVCVCRDTRALYVNAGRCPRFQHID